MDGKTLSFFAVPGKGLRASTSRACFEGTLIEFILSSGHGLRKSPATGLLGQTAGYGAGQARRYTAVIQ